MEDHTLVYKPVHPNSQKGTLAHNVTKRQCIVVRNLTKQYRMLHTPSAKIRHFLEYALGLRARSEPAHAGDYFTALEDISFDVYEGETFGIVGSNGSGKSTLLQILCGTLMPTRGVVETVGKVSALLELGAGFNPEFTGLENVSLSGRIYGLSENTLKQKISAIAEFAEIGDHINQPVKTYSSGMFVRLAFSIVAHLNPKILIIDEALSVGDFAFQQKCIALMRKELGSATKLIVSHDLATLAAVSNRMLVLNRGRIEFIGDPQTAISVYQRAARANQSPSNTLGNTRPTSSSRTAPKQIVQSGSGRVAFTKIDVAIDDQHSATTVTKGARVTLVFTCRVETTITHPILGYQIQNRTGIVVCGANTLGTSIRLLQMGPGMYRGALSFLWPQLAKGEYGITLGIANGTDAVTHDIECWAHNAIVVTNINQSPEHGIFTHSIDNVYIDNIK